MTFQIVNLRNHNVTNMTMNAKYAQCEIVDPSAALARRLNICKQTNMQEYANIYINQ